MKKFFVAIVVMCLVMVSGVMAAVDTATSTATVTVSEFLSVTVDDTTLAFGSLNPGSTNNKPTGDPLVATIGSETNVVSIYVKTKADGTDFCTDYATCSGDKFAVSNLEWSATDFAGTDYTTSDAEVCSGLSASGTCSIYHELEIPGAQAAGSYSTGITITATTA